MKASSKKCKDIKIVALILLFVLGGVTTNLAQRRIGGEGGVRRPVNRPAVQHPVNSGNIHNGNTNIGKGGNTINVNVNNSHHTNISGNNVVRPVNRPYVVAPHAYGGYRYYSYHPYYYHPYHPYAWGPYYHPWGFFIAALATTAIIVSVENQKYHYDQGVYYVASNGGYSVVQAPIGAVVTTLPKDVEVVPVSTTVNNYYYGGTYYEKQANGYKVVPPTAGTIIDKMPEGGKEVKLGDITYVKYGNTYYQPIQKDGKNIYEVVTVEADKK
jgi:hypothetical protein